MSDILNPFEGVEIDRVFLSRRVIELEHSNALMQISYFSTLWWRASFDQIYKRKGSHKIFKVNDPNSTGVQILRRHE